MSRNHIKKSEVSKKDIRKTALLFEKLYNERKISKHSFEYVIKMCMAVHIEMYFLKLYRL